MPPLVILAQSGLVLLLKDLHLSLPNTVVWQLLRGKILRSAVSLHPDSRPSRSLLLLTIVTPMLGSVFAIFASSKSIDLPIQDSSLFEAEKQTTSGLPQRDFSLYTITRSSMHHTRLQHVRVSITDLATLVTLCIE